MTEAALELIEQLEQRDRRDGIVKGSMTCGGPRVIEGGRRHTWAELLRLKTAVRRQAFDRTPCHRQKHEAESGTHTTTTTSREVCSNGPL
jgi:hypothetical protein